MKVFTLVFICIFVNNSKSQIKFPNLDVPFLDENIVEIIDENNATNFANLYKKYLTQFDVLRSNSQGRPKKMSPPGGLEPPTFRLTAERASRLRHGGMLIVLLFLSQLNKICNFFSKKYCRRGWDSNPRGQSPLD